MMEEAAVRRIIYGINRAIEEAQWYLDKHKFNEEIGPDDEKFDAYDYNKKMAEYYGENAALLIISFLNSSNSLTNIYNSLLSKIDGKSITSVGHNIDDEDGTEYSFLPVWETYLRHFRLGITAIGGAVPAEKLATLDNICTGIGKAIQHLFEKDIIDKPDREEVVKQISYALIQSVFHDTVPDGDIKFQHLDGRVTRPDAAVESLRVCLEFKFAENEAELIAAIGSVIDDMSVYGDARYDVFRAVFYVTYDITQEHFDNLFRDRLKKIKPRFEWQAFLSKGPGARKPRGRKGATLAPSAAANPPAPARPHVVGQEG